MHTYIYIYRYNMYSFCLYTIVPVMSRYYTGPLCNYIFITRKLETSTIGHFVGCHESHIKRIYNIVMLYIKKMYSGCYKKRTDIHFKKFYIFQGVLLIILFFFGCFGHNVLSLISLTLRILAVSWSVSNYS
jgi:hypothetical protein